jgi:hypothetical protein
MVSQWIALKLRFPKKNLVEQFPGSHALFECKRNKWLPALAIVG